MFCLSAPTRVGNAGPMSLGARWLINLEVIGMLRRLSIAAVTAVLAAAAFGHVAWASPIATSRIANITGGYNTTQTQQVWGQTGSQYVCNGYTTQTSCQQVPVQSCQQVQTGQTCQRVPTGQMFCYPACMNWGQKRVCSQNPPSCSYQTVCTDYQQVCDPEYTYQCTPTYSTQCTTTYQTQCTSRQVPSCSYQPTYGWVSQSVQVWVPVSISWS